MSVINLARRLDEALTEAIEAKVKNWDFESAIDNAVEDFNFGSHIEKAVEISLDNYDFDDDIRDAVNEFDFEREGKEAVEKAIEDADLDALAHTAVEEALNEQLLPKVKQAVLDLLGDKDFLEKLTVALFERSTEEVAAR
jgi:hypothetical protein